MKKYIPLYESNKVIAYHSSNVPIKKFDYKYASREGGFWFSTDLDSITNGTSGAVSTKYIMKVELSLNNTAGWDEYEDQLTDELIRDGYDSIKLDDDYIVFDPKRIKVLKITNNI